MGHPNWKVKASSKCCDGGVRLILNSFINRFRGRCKTLKNEQVFYAWSVLIFIDFSARPEPQIFFQNDY
jgi:hypothetical protein